MRPGRVVLGLLLQPIVAAALAFAAFSLLERTGSAFGAAEPSDLHDAASAIAAGAAFAAIFLSLCIGLPVAVWLVPRRKVRLRDALLIGAEIATVPVLLIAAVAGSYGLAGLARAVAFAALLGAAGAAVFWRVAIHDVSGPEPQRARLE